jgi:RES domain
MADRVERPSPHPEPPADLFERTLPLLHMQDSWYRIHRSAHNPLYYGQSARNRFNASNKEYGVMYVALNPDGAFIETFGSETGVRIVSKSELSSRSISILASQHPLNLVDITGPGLAHLGADGRLCTGDHKLAQRWAMALWEHPAQVDGIYYRARHDLSQTCASIFDRTKIVFDIVNTRTCTSKSFEKDLALILESYQFGFIE